MDYKKNKKILLEFLRCQTSEELEKIVKGEKLNQEGWLPYGGRSQNAGDIEGQMLEADNALMEKITNSIDAILMRRCYEEGIDPCDRKTAPKTMAEAVEKFFGGKELLREKRSEFAKEWLRVTAEGKKDRPTITIIDKGEGQQPNNIKETILSLGKDIKEKIPFVYGTYNKGGSCPLGFAGNPCSYDFNYLQLVLCRRPPTIKDKEKTKNHDHFGFTIVRKRFDYASDKFTYEYLVEKNTGDIFSFPAEEPVEISDYRFEEGCVVKLYDYQLPQRGNIVFRGLNEFIDKKLPVSPLPIYLKELRSGYGGGIDYSVFGLKEKLLRKKESLRDTYPQKLPVDLGEIGKKEVELFILKHKAESKENPSDMLERVFFTKDGLVLHTENMSWLRNECDLVDLSPYVFAFIDISTINPPIAQMLHSGREKFKNNVTTRLVLDRLKIFFASETLKELDKEYGKLGFSSESAFKDEAFRKELMKEVENQPELRDFFELGEDFPIKEDDGKEPPQDPDYEGTYLPEKFDLVGSSPREVEDSSYCKISFDTGADAKLFERREDRGEYDWEKSENFQIAFSSFKNGRLTFRVDPNQETKPPQEEALVFHLRVPSKNVEMKGIVTVLLREKIPYEGKKFPTFFTPPKKIKIPVTGITHLRIQTDATNNYFERDEEPGLINFDEHDYIEFGNPRLKDGILAVRLRCLSDEVKESKDIKVRIKDKENEFNLSIPVKITPPETEPQVDLPKPETVERKNWANDTPEWDEDVVARIPSWRDLKRIKINIDSRPFDDLKKIPAHSREAAKDMLFKQIYINSIWMFLEFKDLDVGGNNSVNGADIKGQVFEKAIRAASKMTIQNIKKLIR
ncbi:hypothetical protein KKE88_02900 [Patescibacteria group bacterium]|nr:hypothetical protein [Patescibacteria group bacterium]